MINYYKILGLTRQAKFKEIKRVYRQQALRYHPDKNQNSDTHEIFIKINQAYEVLSDSSKRKQYDHLYDKYILNKTKTYNQQKETQWKETVKKSEEAGKQKGEKFAENFDLFSKKVMEIALIYLLLEVGLVVLFGGFTNLAFLAGLAFTIIGIFSVLTEFQDTTAIILGIALIISGILILRWNLKKVAKELMQKNKNGT